MPPLGSAGSYYYHSHVGFSTSTATGPLIVEDTDRPPYKYAEERTVFIQEFWNRTDDEISKGLTATPLVWPGQPNGWLINGMSISNWLANDEFIAASSLSVAIFAFDNHTDWMIIAADGSYTRPQPVKLCQMGSGQRYDAIIQAKSCSEIENLGRLDYYIQFETRERNPVVTNFAVLRYKNTCGFTHIKRIPEHTNPPVVPLALSPTDPKYLELQLEPYENNNFPTSQEVTRRIFLDHQQVFNGYGRWEINNNSWRDQSDNVKPHTTPLIPYLVAIYRNQSKYLPDYDAAVANYGLDPKTQTYPAQIGEVLEIVLQNKGARSVGGLVQLGALDTHPWHAHGVHIYDVGSGQGSYDSAAAELQLKGKRPVLRDTTLLYKYVDQVNEGEVASWRAWRLRVNSPGVWMIHCHTLQHMIQGMQTVWVHGDAKDIMKLGHLDVQGYLNYGGNVYGNITHAPEVIHFHEVT